MCGVNNPQPLEVVDLKPQHRSPKPSTLSAEERVMAEPKRTYRFLQAATPNVDTSGYSRMAILHPPLLLPPIPLRPLHLGTALLPSWQKTLRREPTSNCLPPAFTGCYGERVQFEATIATSVSMGCNSQGGRHFFRRSFQSSPSGCGQSLCPQPEGLRDRG